MLNDLYERDVSRIRLICTDDPMSSDDVVREVSSGTKLHRYVTHLKRGIQNIIHNGDRGGV